MKRFSLILASLVLVFGAKASAFVGGPFDNGDYSGFLDNTGVYQVSFRMSNGSGFAQFGNNAITDVFRIQTGTAVPSNTFTIVNRSIIYFKGVTYLGTCFGMVDHERKTVSGVTNGSSDVVTATALNPTTSIPGGAPGGAGGLPGAATNATASLLNNGNLGFPCNTHWICKITKSYPVLRFNGTGELTVINPSLAEFIYDQLASVEISQLDAPATGTTPAVNPPQPTAVAIQNYADAINNLVNATSDSIPSVQQVRRTSERVKLFAFGSRIFFVGQR